MEDNTTEEVVDETTEVTEAYKCETETLTFKGFKDKLLAKTDVLSDDGTEASQTFSPVGALARLGFFILGALTNGLFVKKDIVR